MNPLFTNFDTATLGSGPRGAREGQPLVGLSVNVDGPTSRLAEAYVRAVLDAGGVPLLIPASTDAGALRRAVEALDGLILTGGSDVGGRYFGEPTSALAEVDPLRDAYDFLLLRLAADRQLPVFGICRGMQVMGIAFGGSIWQDIPSQLPGKPLDHSILSPRERPVHPVSIDPDSVLARVLGRTRVAVNSRHHQALRTVPPGFRVSATAPDGVIEAIEAYPAYRMMGVQWHPENMAAEGGDAGMKALFDFVVAEAALFRAAKRIHEKHLVVDSHGDTPMLFADHAVDFGRRDAVARIDLAKMAEGRLDAAIIAAYLPQGPRDPASLAAAFGRATGLLDAMARQVETHAADAGLARTFAEADRLKSEGRRAILLAVENGHAIGRDLANIERLADRGVVYITLCHNGPNELCDSARGPTEHGGLSALGRAAVAGMNRAGVAVDLSHAAETTFYDVLEASRAPVICSHSSARALCDHPRNLADDQIRAIAEKGGVVQVCLYGPFLAAGREATLADAIDHVEHIARVGGIHCVGIGSDFDGDGGIAGCRAANEYIDLTVELLRRGHSADDIAAILGGNLRRAIERVQQLKPE